MTQSQDRGYWRRWAAACAEQGWKSSDTERRRAVHHSVNCPDSHKDFNNAQTTRVFDALDALARTEDLNAQVRCAEHEEHDDTARREELTHSIRCLASILTDSEVRADAYILTICRDMNSTSHWTELPVEQTGPRGMRYHHDLTNLRNTLKSRVSKRITQVKALQCPVPLLLEGFDFSLSNDVLIATRIRKYRENVVPAENCPY